MSRVIADKAATAFVNRQSMSARNNTYCDGDRLYLHGNLIAWWDANDTPWLTLAGWNTPTTRDRVNAVGCALEQRGYGQHSFSQRKKEPYYNGKLISANDSFPCVGPLTALALAAEKRNKNQAADQIPA